MEMIGFENVCLKRKDDYKEKRNTRNILYYTQVLIPTIDTQYLSKIIIDAKLSKNTTL